MSKHTKLLQFDKKTALKIAQRDKECLFCKMAYHMHSTTQLAYQIQDIMHFVNKSDGGLGIEQNGVLGCRYHHSLLDNGNKGLRQEMLEIMERHLKSIYKDWTREALVYKKYSFETAAVLRKEERN